MTIDKEFHSFVFSLLPVAHFLCLLHVGSERDLAAYPLGSGLMLLLLHSSLLSSSPHGIALLAGLEYLSLTLMILLMSSMWDLSMPPQSRERR